MKRMLFWVAMAAMTTASCSKNEPIETAKNEAISFGTYVGLSTKGADASIATLKASGFTVNGYYTETDWTADNGTATPNIMYQIPITHDGAAWGYDQLVYWPQKGKVSFFANSTHGAGLVTDPSTNAQTGVPFFKFTAPDAATAQIDCLAAVALDKDKQGGAVAFTFKHILSKIGFTAVLKDLPANNTVVTVTNLAVNYATSKVNSNGIYTHNTATGQDGTIEVGSWATTGTDYHQTTAGDVIDGAGVTMKTDALQAVQLNAIDKFLMIVPQALEASDISVEMTYTVKVGENEKLTYTKTANIPAMTFAAQTSYQFNIQIDLNQDAIRFGDPEIKDWITGTVPTTL